MSPVLDGAFALLLYPILRTTVTALFADRLGFTLRGVSFGFGHPIVKSGILTIRAFPIGGSVSIESAGARPLWKKLLVPLATPILLLAFTLQALGGVGTGAFVAAFAQIPVGALDPLGDGQDFLARFAAYASRRPIPFTVCLVMIKLAAFDLLPFVPLAGGKALLAAVRNGGGARGMPRVVMKLSIIPVIVLGIGWAVAFLVFTWRSLA